LPSSLFVGTRNTLSILRKDVKPGLRVIEIGCAPGKILAWVRSVTGVTVSGLDYSTVGISHARQLFVALGLDADLRCEDLVETSFEPGRFDLAYSIGVVEHFEQPARVVRKHVELLRPGGVCIIAIPNYTGIYRWLQQRLDPENLALHNLSIMSKPGLLGLVPGDLSSSADAFLSGRLNTSLISVHRALPPLLAAPLQWAGNLLGLLQVVPVTSLSPLWVLRIRRA
jgi:2-polyprenyl-3-methyl-5-hydroxy-6-metoxy-1,4-benzoquinol methylase